MVLNGRVDRLLVIDSVTDKPVDILIDLVQQLRHLGGILFVAFAYGGGDDQTLVIDTDVELFPALDLNGASLSRSSHF